MQQKIHNTQDSIPVSYTHLTPTPVAPNPVTPPQAAPTPAPAPTPTPVQAAPSQSSREIKQGFENLVTALKTVWKNPAEAASALAKKESWLAALILIAAQALFSGLFALTNYGVGLEHNSAKMCIRDSS